MLEQNRERRSTRGPTRRSNKMTMLALNASYDHQRDAPAGCHRLHAPLAHGAPLNGDLNDDYDPPTVTETGVENRTRTQPARRGPGAAVHASAVDASN
jgi:hypothetical protein